MKHLNDWVIQCFVESQYDRRKALEFAQTTEQWEEAEPRILYKGWLGLFDEAKRALPVKLSRATGTRQLQFDLAYPVADGSLKETLHLNYADWQYLKHVRRVQRAQDDAREADLITIEKVLSPWWKTHPDSTFEEALQYAGIGVRPQGANADRG